MGAARRRRADNGRRFRRYRSLVSFGGAAGRETEHRCQRQHRDRLGDAESANRFDDSADDDDPERRRGCVRAGRHERQYQLRHRDHATDEARRDEQQSPDVSQVRSVRAERLRHDRDAAFPVPTSAPWRGPIRSAPARARFSTTFLSSPTTPGSNPALAGLPGTIGLPEERRSTSFYRT